MSRGWYKNKELPHFSEDGRFQFVTIRLWDSLPLEKIALISELKNSENKLKRDRYYRILAKYEDRNYGECYFNNLAVAQTTKESLLKFDDQLYELGPWTIMPNHLHIIIKQKVDLEKIITTLKSSIAIKSNIILNRKGTFWMKNYFDCFIRDKEHLELTIKYIQENPVTSGLVDRAEKWPWSSIGAEAHRLRVFEMGMGSCHTAELEILNSMVGRRHFRNFQDL